MTSENNREVARIRAAALLGQMTLAEKCLQLTAVGPWDLQPDSTTRRAYVPDGVAPGHVAGLMLDDPRQFAEEVARLQSDAVNNTRLGIPMLFHGEALNGVLSGGHMVFPTAIGLASTWSPELVEEMSALIRKQMVQIGIRHALSPVMDVALDPRWGRVHETYGEDPYLAAAFSVAFTRGIQGPDLREGVFATGKHFLGYANPESGINQAAVEVGPRRLRDLFAFPFEAAIQLADLRSIMNSYSEIDGIPVGASREILTDLLRGTLDFDGFVCSDYMTLEFFVRRQGVASDAGAAGALAIKAGLDVEFPKPYGYGTTLIGQVEQGNVDEALVDESVLRVLSAKFELGLFENPYPNPGTINLADTAVEGNELSRELARRSVVLVQNDGILPLKESLRVAVIGPHAANVTWQFPPYTYPSFREMTLVMSNGGMGAQVGVAPELVRWNSERLSAIETEEFVRERHGAQSLSDHLAASGAEVQVHPGTGLVSRLPGDAFRAAVDAAAAADAVILALGGASLWFQGERTEGEGSDSADIALPEVQAELAEAVIATGRPVIVVLTQGRAYTLPASVATANAIVVSSYNGPHGPGAVADVLLGDTQPEGRLPYSIPRHGGQVPVYHHRKTGSGPNSPLPLSVDGHYLDMPATPLVPFGRGLTYTSFDIALKSALSELSTKETGNISISATNTGGRDGVCIVQLYASVHAKSVVQPAQQLVGYARVPLRPGESRVVTFQLNATQFAFTGLDREMAVEPGRVSWFAGLDAEDHRVVGQFAIEGERTSIRTDERTFFSSVSIRTV